MSSSDHTLTNQPALVESGDAALHWEVNDQGELTAKVGMYDVTIRPTLHGTYSIAYQNVYNAWYPSAAAAQADAAEFVALVRAMGVPAAEDWSPCQHS